MVIIHLVSSESLLDVVVNPLFISVVSNVVRTWRFFASFLAETCIFPRVFSRCAKIGVEF
jgi:hypothetical protein